MKLHDYFEHLLDATVNLNQSRIDSLDARVAAITTFLKAHPELGPLVLDVIAHGSYAQRTIIKPRVHRDFDADVLLELVEQPGWEPCQYIAKLYSAFRSSPTYKPMVDRKTRCVTVDYANDFHIDVVPYVERAGTHYITNRKDNRFELTNPTGFNEWLDTQNRAAGGHLVHVIRLMKFLRDFKGTFGVKSVILTTLLGGRVNDALTFADPKYYGDLPTALYHISRDLDAYLQGSWFMPVLTDPSCPSENFNHRWNQDRYANFREKIHFYAATISAAYEETDKTKSIELWQQVFGPGFQTSPAPVVESAARAKALAATTEKDIERDLGMPIVTSGHTLHIVGCVGKVNGFREYDLPTRGNKVTKNRRLVFRVARCSVPQPHNIYWKIKNTGAEATAAGCLRGEIAADGGERRRVESTAYRGTHYVECYVVKDGRCIAKDRQTVIVE
jgi:hypothetical protein